MLKNIPLEHILFLDIETVPQKAAYADLNDQEKQLWDEKSRYQRKEEQTAEEFYERAGIWAEFGKIICLSAGYFVVRNKERKFRVTSFYGEETDILKRFRQLLESYFNKPYHVLCAHNGKEFDFPYIARRMVIHQQPLPEKLIFFGKKPWEIPHLDTLELWKFGDYKHYTSLKLLTHALGIPSPKTDLEGSKVREVYYEEADLSRIVAYCEQDTLAVAQVLLRLRGEPLLGEGEIVSV